VADPAKARDFFAARFGWNPEPRLGGEDGQGTSFGLYERSVES
jgi:hypothetical protein